MSEIKTESAINIRYSELADTSCCLSCGGAVNHAKAGKNEICVDLGSGRGTDAIRMAESVGREGMVYGLDISDGMLKTAEKTASRLGIENIKFIKTDLEDMPLEENTVDLVISNCVINHAENKQNVWNEVHRILKAGGRFVVSDIYSSAPVPEEYKNDPEAVAECWAGSVTREEYLKQLENAGFTSVEILEESDPYPKGKITVSSWTILGYKAGCCCCK
ncbi:MAG: methyltransferase domain-containing protein [Spirochaetales bacterium]|uniref:Arsenite methyltransferase n=1 Tax=Candidatus Thalassospirochaeta sargassi TaxID=3119039 RepID=A0AAJ1IF47_9SPIO|nr:methyltransferase domain-containing protein [Spirochaetales bacterium]